jgi:SAM-dependent methyltransferase
VTCRPLAAGELYDSWDDSRWGAHETELRAIGSSASVLDVGCATGNLALRLMARGLAVVGVEPNEKAAEVARSRGVEVIIGRFDRSTLDGLGGRRFEAIVFADSLEHMVDPFEALVLARGSLEAGGKIVICLPNIVVWYARAMIALGHFDYRPIGIFDRTHLRFFTLRTARRLVERAGYRVERIRMTSVPLPVGLHAPGWLRRIWDQGYVRLASYAPGLLAEQFVIVARPTDDPVIRRVWP